MVVKLTPHQLHSLIFLTIHGVQFTLPHDWYSVEASWWDKGHSRVNYLVINTEDGVFVKMWNLDFFSFASPTFVERSLLFTKGRVNGKPIPTRDGLQDWIKEEVPDLRATRWSEYHDSYRWFDVDSLFFLDPWYTLDEKIASCQIALQKIKKIEEVPNLLPWRGIQGRLETKK